MGSPLVLLTASADQTRALGRRIGERLAPGQVVALEGSLGSGKTCLVQGMAVGLGVPEAMDVTSPSYTLLNEYPGRLTLLHFDLYRLAGADEAEAIGFFERLHGGEVTVIEWAGRIASSELGSHLRIAFAVTGDTERRLTLTGDGLAYGDLISSLAEEP